MRREEMKESGLSGRVFSLPFINETIRLDRAGARYVAWLSCKMAAANASPLESDREHARRFAAFVLGIIAAQCPEDFQRLVIFRNFLSEVQRWLNQGCADCGKEHDWSAFDGRFGAAAETECETG